MDNALGILTGYAYLSVFAVPLVVVTHKAACSIAREIHSKRQNKLKLWEFVALAFIVNLTLNLAIGAALIFATAGFILFGGGQLLLILGLSSVFATLFALMTGSRWLRSQITNMSASGSWMYGGFLRLFLIGGIAAGITFHIFFVLPRFTEDYLSMKAGITGNVEDIENAYQYDSQKAGAYRELAVERGDPSYCAHIEDYVGRAGCVRAVDSGYYLSRKQCILGLQYDDPHRENVYHCLMRTLDIASESPCERPSNASAVVGFKAISLEILNDIDAACAHSL